MFFTLTAEAWQIPYAIRVDSLSNFQHTEGIEDDLIVGDLITDATALEDAELARKQQISLAEPLLNGQLVTADGAVTAVVCGFALRNFVSLPEVLIFKRRSNRN